MTSLITVTLLIVIPFQSFAYAGRRKEPAIKACGSALADIVASVCDGKYNLNKRGDSPQNQNDDLEPDYYYNQELFIDTDSAYPFRSKRSATSMLKPYRSHKRSSSLAILPVSIVHECCLKACSQDELLGYCATN